jgi:hypothetical protein
MRIDRKIAIGLTLSFVALDALSSSRTEAQEPSFEAAHIERSASVTLEGSSEEVFALLEPLGRKRWVKRWNFEYLWPPSGEAQPGTVVRQAHQSGAVEQIWLLAEHESPTRIKYVIFVAEMETWEFDTHLKPTPEGKTIATFDHRITSLAEPVNAEVQHFADDFDAYVGRVRLALNKALSENRD